MPERLLVFCDENADVKDPIVDRWVSRIRGLAGVDRAEPYVVMFGQMTMSDGRFENVVVVGSEAGTLLGNAWVMADGSCCDSSR